jgi:GR25 family glycosyltransferase involved in LPS biosynthesis
MPTGLFFVALALLSFLGILARQLRRHSAEAPALLDHSDSSIEVWVINLNRRPDRLAAFENSYKGSFFLWSGTDGLQLTSESAAQWGVDPLMSWPCSGETLRHAGVIGCWISHKRLLEHLAQRHSRYFVIAEDDAQLTEADVQRFRQTQPSLPEDWHLFFLGIMHPCGEPYSREVQKLTKCPFNWGTHAYVINAVALPEILEALRYMSNAIDIQLGNNFDRWNVFAFRRGLVSQSGELGTDT